MHIKIPVLRCDIVPLGFTSSGYHSVKSNLDFTSVFLESKKMWRFYDRSPRPYHSLEALPLPVFEFFSHFSAVKTLIDDKKKSFQVAAKEFTAAKIPEEPEAKKPQKRKKGFWSFLKNIFGK